MSQKRELDDLYDLLQKGSIRPSTNAVAHFMHHHNFEVLKTCSVRDYNDVGKWCIFCHKTSVDEAWERVKAAVDTGRLWTEAKVSTTLGYYSHVKDQHVICVYTRDWKDAEDVWRSRDVLREFGFVEPLQYKRDLDTRSRNDVFYIDEKSADHK